MVYLDYNATTPIDPRVLDRMLPYFTEQFGNAGSALHAYGWAAAEAVKRAREHMAALLEASPEELVFTSGATESVVLAIKGVAAAYVSKGRHFITVATEHKAVLEAHQDLARAGADVTILPVDATGRVAQEDLIRALRPDTILVSIMWANNETGTLQDIPALYETVRQHGGALFLTDATQAVGKVPVSVAHADLLAFSGHKFYAPKGIGGLYIRRRNPRVTLQPLQSGGGQERGLRGGTLNVPGIVGLGAAAAIIQNEGGTEPGRIRALRDQLASALRASIPDMVIHTPLESALPNTLNFRVERIRTADLAKSLHQIALSSGSACSSGLKNPSHVLLAMGLTPAQAASTVRLSLGRMTTASDVQTAAGALIRVLR